MTGADADALLATHAGGEVDPTVREQLVTGTGGNPLALIELAGVLTGEQLAGRAPLPTPLPTNWLESGSRNLVSRMTRTGDHIPGSRQVS